MTARRGKSGQVAIFLVLILAGLALLFALNVDIFTSSKAKIRLQNSADASALALARWQGVTLNMVGDLNIAHMAAICQSNVNAIAGIVQLQERLSFIGPTIGFKAANEIAEKNGVPVSQDMTLATRLVSEAVDEGYRRMIDIVVRDGVRAGVDNAAIHKPFPVKDFFDAIRQRNFRWLCRYNGGRHALPEIPAELQDPEEIMLNGSGNACFGSIGVAWQSGAFYESRIGELSEMARDCGIDASIVNRQALTTNATLFAYRQWCVYDHSEWRDFPADYGFSRFPWLTPFRDEYAICGGSATVRIEGTVELSSISATTNFIASQAAAKVFGSVNGGKVTSVDPPIVLPSFSRARLVPFGPGSAGRYGLANLNHVRSMLGLFGRPESENGYAHLLDVYRSESFRNAAEAWYSQHGHNDADGCCPPGHGTERGGGTPYGI